LGVKACLAQQQQYVIDVSVAARLYHQFDLGILGR
jgi:hypothetical protein